MRSDKQADQLLDRHIADMLTTHERCEWCAGSHQPWQAAVTCNDELWLVCLSCLRTWLAQEGSS